jgi:alpha/beta superfamily hydrolase
MNTPVIRLIDAPTGRIETASLLCDLSQLMPRRALLILHPHPLHGGTMGNKVVTTIARVARDAGLPAVAFNFRGAGRSDGVWDRGEGELIDAFHIASLMIRQGVSELCLAGFSFGASIAARLIQKLRDENVAVDVIDLIQIAPAVENFPIDLQAVGDVPRTVIYNGDDEVVSPDAIGAYASAVGAQVMRSETGGHFFHGELTRLKQAVWTHFLERGIV